MLMYARVTEIKLKLPKITRAYFLYDEADWRAEWIDISNL